VNTPEERKLGPSFISSRSTFSPSSDSSQPLHVNNERTTVQVCCHLPPDTRELSGPRLNELALYYQLALTRSIDNGDL
jgi:hypothetical protein